MFDDDDGIFDDALAFGTGYAFYRHGQDAQTARLERAIGNLNGRPDHDAIPEAPDPEDTEPEAMPINALEFTTADLPQGWDDYIGQGPLKEQLLTRTLSCMKRGQRLPHILLESGFPGVGKTTMARLLAVITGNEIIELVPPFKIEAIIRAAQSLPDHGILFIDEIHKMTDGVGARGAEVLLKLLEDGVIFEPDGTVHTLNDITVIGATTEADKLPDPVLDRFKVHPYFQAYSRVELARITVQFVWKHFAENEVTPEVIYTISGACRGIPRVAETMVEACQALSDRLGRQATSEELLDHMEIQPDGMTRKHIAYITALRRYYAREIKGGGVEYIIGEAAIQQRLRETKQGIGRIENFLIELGLIDRTPRGRRLTAPGIARAEEFMDEGVDDVA